MRKYSQQISFDFGQDEVELTAYPILLEDGLVDLSELFESLDPTGLYPNKKQLIEQIYRDVLSFIAMSEINSFSNDCLKIIEKELSKSKTDIVRLVKKNEIKELHKKFLICESLRQETPKDCHAIVLLKVALLNAVVHKTHPQHSCENLARQIRLACRDGDCRNDLLTTLSKSSEFGVLKPDLFVSWLVEASEDQLQNEPNLVRRLTAFFTTISYFFGHQPPVNSEYLFFTHRKTVRVATSPIIDAKTSIANIFSSYIRGFEIETTRRWLENALTRSVTCYSRLNSNERYELIANLNDLAASQNKNDKWAALTMLLVYHCGKTIREVNQLKFGEDLIVDDDLVYLKRELRVPEDAGQVAPVELCKPQAYSILLPLPDSISDLVKELSTPKQTFKAVIETGIDVQIQVIKKHLKVWRDFGRYDLKMSKLIAALTTEISIQTQHPLTLFALASRPNHRFPTIAYYAGESHQHLLSVWNEAQDYLSLK